ncbi:MAG TPA: sialidase family protein [Candidatus Binatia bacterium]|nr:sialidase family protein [Candidatus Binatia bacterium]
MTLVRSAALALIALAAPLHAASTAPEVPTYQTFAPPKGLGSDNSGEFNIGFNPKTGRILAFASANIYRLTPPEKLSPAQQETCPALWEDVSPPVVQLEPEDPILWTDQLSGRTFASNWTQGAGIEYAFSDDDGTTWIQAGVAPPDGGIDHETIGTGPYPADSPFGAIAAATGFPNAVYYCSQGAEPAFCQRSDNGGVSFGPSVPIYTGVTSDCASLHGHIHVGPDGTAYVPNGGCDSGQGGAMSTDAGLTWSEFIVPDTIGGGGKGSDPSMAIDKDNTAYFCYANAEVNGGGKARVAVSHDHGQTWTDDTDIGLPFGIVTAAFPQATVGGDPGRASCGFLGTTTKGDWQAATFKGVWYLYIATTYDGGKTWTTVSVDPKDPVQGQGGICLSGLGCSGRNRNLLDFNETTIDDRGRVLFGYVKGCTGSCIANPARNPFSADMRVVRQLGGRTLFAKYDGDAGAAHPACGSTAPPAALPSGSSPTLRGGAAGLATLLPLLAGLLLRRRRAWR